MPLQGFEYRNEELYCEQTPLAQIAERVKTPCYVYSAGTITGNYEAYSKACGAAPHTVHYSVKARRLDVQGVTRSTIDVPDEVHARSAGAITSRRSSTTRPVPRRPAAPSRERGAHANRKRLGGRHHGKQERL